MRRELTLLLHPPSVKYVIIPQVTWEQCYIEEGKLADDGQIPCSSSDMGPTRYSSTSGSSAKTVASLKMRAAPVIEEDEVERVQWSVECSPHVEVITKNWLSRKTSAARMNVKKLFSRRKV